MSTAPVRTSTFRKPFFSDGRRSLRLQVGVLRVLRDEIEQARTDPGQTSTLLRQMDEELDRLEALIDDLDRGA
jgi:hypothetical protein